jgi:hypothetical protein
MSCEPGHAWAGIYSYQTNQRYLQTALFEGFSPRRLGQRFTHLHPTTGQAPHVEILSPGEEQAVMIVKNGDVDTQGRHGRLEL